MFDMFFSDYEMSEDDDENDMAMNDDTVNDPDWQPEMEEECEEVEEECEGEAEQLALVEKSALQKLFSQINCQKCGSSDYVTTDWKSVGTALIVNLNCLCCDSV